MPQGVQEKSPKKRLIYLDLLRGALLVAIILNHVPYSPKITDIFTGDGLLISSAAEGFFLLSGLMVGYLYLPKILINTKSVLKKIWSRSLLLYILSIATTLVFSLLALIFIDPTEAKSLYPDNIFSLNFIQHLLSLQYTFGWADFLSRYAIFMFFAPIALFLMAYKKTAHLLVLSVLIWFISPLFDWGSIVAWQLLFIVGIVIGGNLSTILNFFSAKNGKRLLTIILVVSALSLLWSMYVSVIYPHFILRYLPDIGTLEYVYSKLYMYPDLYVSLFDKETLGPLRILFSVFWFISILYLFKKHENVIQKTAGRLLSFFGSNSLIVYISHAFIIFGVATIYIFTPDSLGLLTNTGIAILCVLITYLITKVFLFIKERVSLK